LKEYLPQPISEVSKWSGSDPFKNLWSQQKKRQKQREIGCTVHRNSPLSKAIRCDISTPSDNNSSLLWRQWTVARLPYFPKIRIEELKPGSPQSSRLIYAVSALSLWLSSLSALWLMINPESDFDFWHWRAQTRSLRIWIKPLCGLFCGISYYICSSGPRPPPIAYPNQWSDIASCWPSKVCIHK